MLTCNWTCNYVTEIEIKNRILIDNFVSPLLPIGGRTVHSTWLQVVRRLRVAVVQLLIEEQQPASHVKLTQGTCALIKASAPIIFPVILNYAIMCASNELQNLQDNPSYHCNQNADTGSVYMLCKFQAVTIILQPPPTKYVDWWVARASTSPELSGRALPLSRFVQLVSQHVRKAGQ